jgi:hypothetical protein
MDEGLSSEMASMALATRAADYLSTKPVLMNNPGVKLDSIYYSAMTSQVEAVENTWNLGRLILTLPTTGFGSSNQVLIPNSNLQGGVFLQLLLPINGVANLCLPRGWGYAAIQSINYQMGSSNANQQQINGQSVWQIVQEQCGSEEKASEFFLQAGDALLGQNSSSVSGNVEANVFLPFPFSSACGSHAQKYPFDTDMLSTPIFLTVTFNLGVAFIGGTGTPPSSFTQAQIVCRQGELFNKDASLGPLIKRNAALIYSYPFIHRQSFTSPQVTGVVSGGLVSINLLSILNADLVAISFGVVKVSDLVPSAGGCPNPNFYQPITNIQLQFNGQVMYNAPNNLQKLYQAYMIEGAGLYHGLQVTGTSSPWSGNLADLYVTTIDFSRMRESCFSHFFSNVWRIGNNSLSLQFNTPDTSQYVCYVTYAYNAMVDVQNGQTRIIY